jgi:hypothetical protein
MHRRKTALLALLLVFFPVGAAFATEQTPATLKGYFSTGAKPTATNFWDQIDSFAWTRADTAQRVKGVWNVSAAAAISDHGALVAGSIASVSAEAPEGAEIVLAPNVVYLVGTTIVPKNGQRFRSTRSGKYLENSAGAVIRSTAPGVLFDLTGKKGVQFEGLILDGANLGTYGLYQGKAITAEGCTLTRFTTAAAGGTSEYPSLRLFRNEIHGNRSGIQNAVDFIIMGNYIYANTLDGINLQAGSGDGVIVGNKLEWNQRYNLHLYQANHIAGTGNVLDRSYSSGAFLDGVRDVTLAENHFARSARTASATADKAHIQIHASSNVVMSGNTFRHGKDDDGTGADTPAYVLSDRGDNSDVAFSGNGASEGFVEGRRTGTTSYLLIDGNAGWEASKTYKFPRVTAKGGGGTVTVDIPTEGLAAFGRLIRKVRFVARDTTTGGTTAGEQTLVVKRESGDAAMETGTLVDTIGGFGAAITPTYAVTANGETILLTLTNGSAHAQQINVEVW